MNNKKGFTLIELIVVMVIIMILSTFGVKSLNMIDGSNLLDSYGKSVQDRTFDLYQKSIIGQNFYYNNKGITKPTHLKMYCDNSEKNITAFVCDDINNVPISSNINGCAQIDFPTIENARKNSGNMISFGNGIISFDSCLYQKNSGENFVEGDYYFTISLVDQAGLLQGYKEPDSGKTKTDIIDDEEVNKIKIKLSSGNYINEFEPLTF